MCRSICHRVCPVLRSTASRKLLPTVSGGVFLCPGIRPGSSWSLLKTTRLPNKMATYHSHARQRRGRDAGATVHGRHDRGPVASPPRASSRSRPRLLRPRPAWQWHRCCRGAGHRFSRDNRAAKGCGRPWCQGSRSGVCPNRDHRR